MVKLEILHKSPTEIMEIVREIRKMGWIQGKDFDFAYHPAHYNNDGFEAVSPKYTKFLFYNEKYATMFTLKFM
jgi:hypothetical protein